MAINQGCEFSALKKKKKKNAFQILNFTLNRKKKKLFLLNQLKFETKF